MASSKQFSMDFMLNASMNGGFKTTFSRAQTEFTKLGKEIQSLHRVQGDIASYQKQQSAIESTRSKLESLQKQHDLLQKEISETTGATTGLEREKVKLEERIKNTETALERQNQKLSDTGTRLREAGVNTGNLAQKDQELTAKIKELETEQSKAADGAASFGERSSQAFGAIQQAIAAAGIAVALKEITDAYMECVGMAGDFEETMSNVEALSQANAQDMAALSAQAKNLGANTKFTAQEAGNAMGYMAMAGWDAQDMLQGMDGVLNLAAASGEDLAMVSDIVTDSLSAFGLTAKDTAHFSDVLAAAATKSNTNVSIMGETFKMSASVAGALGYSVEDVAVAMGLMANSGVKGSIAGTALRNTFNGLLEGVTLTGAAFGEYEYSAIKADGTMKSFGSTIDELRGYFDQMTEAERVNNAQAVAGQRGYNGLLAILNATDEDYASLTNSINNCTGAANRMANIKLDNLNGQLTLMDSAWDALKTTLGEEFNPELRGLAEIATDVIGWTNTFVQEHPALVKGILASASAVGAGVVTLTGVVTVTKVLIPLMGMLSASIPGVNIIMGVTAAIAGAVGVITALVTAVNEGVPSVKELTEAARDMKQAMKEANATYEETATKTLATAQVADTYINKLEELEATLGDNAKENKEYHNILALLTRTVPELADEIDLENNVIKGGTEALRQHTEAWKKDAETQAYQEYINSLYDKYNEVMTESAENSIKLTQAEIQKETAEKNLANAVERMNQLQKEARDNNTDLSQEYFHLQDAVYGYNNEIYKSEKTIKNLNKAIAEDEEAVAAAEEAINGAEDAVARLTNVTAEQNAASAEAATQAAELERVVGGVAEQMAALTECYQEAYTAAQESISGQYDLWDKAKGVAETSARSINSALESQITYWQKYNANLQSLTDRSADIEGLSTVIASFADGSADSVNAIAGLANASDAELRSMVTNWQSLQKEQAAAAESVADLKTDFTATMNEMTAEVAKDIKEMNLAEEAKDSAKQTIQGYIDGANSMLLKVQATYRNLAKIASDALGRQFTYSGQPVVPKNQYASGTDNAEPGFALVGERGPEIVYFGGGEKVLNAERTAALQNEARPAASAMLLPESVTAAGTPSIQVTFQIGGNATSEVVGELHGFADEIVDRVMDTLENASIDARRRAY